MTGGAAAAQPGQQAEANLCKTKREPSKQAWQYSSRGDLQQPAAKDAAKEQCPSIMQLAQAQPSDAQCGSGSGLKDLGETMPGFFGGFDDYSASADMVAALLGEFESDSRPASATQPEQQQIAAQSDGLSGSKSSNELCPDGLSAAQVAADMRDSAGDGGGAAGNYSEFARSDSDMRYSRGQSTAEVQQQSLLSPYGRQMQMPPGMYPQIAQQMQMQFMHQQQQQQQQQLQSGGDAASVQPEMSSMSGISSNTSFTPGSHPQALPPMMWHSMMRDFMPGGTCYMPVPGPPPFGDPAQFSNDAPLANGSNGMLAAMIALDHGAPNEGLTAQGGPSFAPMRPCWPPADGPGAPRCFSFPAAVPGKHQVVRQLHRQQKPLQGRPLRSCSVPETGAAALQLPSSPAAIGQGPDSQPMSPTGAAGRGSVKAEAMGCPPPGWQMMGSCQTNLKMLSDSSLAEIKWEYGRMHLPAGGAAASEAAGQAGASGAPQPGPGPARMPSMGLVLPHSGEHCHAEDSAAQRHEMLERYRDKKKRRLTTKMVRYVARKINADARPRIKGRFVKGGGDAPCTAEAAATGEADAAAEAAAP